MNNIERAAFNRLRAGICRLAVKLENHSLPYSPELSQVLKRSELDAVQRYVSNHALYPELNGSLWDDLEEEKGGEK